MFLNENDDLNLTLKFLTENGSFKKNRLNSNIKKRLRLQSLGVVLYLVKVLFDRCFALNPSR